VIQSSLDATLVPKIEGERRKGRAGGRKWKKGGGRKGASCTWLFRLVPKVGSLTGSKTRSLLEASTRLFRPLSTVPTSVLVNSAYSCRPWREGGRVGGREGGKEDGKAKIMVVDCGTELCIHISRLSSTTLLPALPSLPHRHLHQVVDHRQELRDIGDHVVDALKPVAQGGDGGFLVVREERTWAGDTGEERTQGVEAVERVHGKRVT